ncbi:MAG TPA: hypothetical protein VMV20_05175 [Chitinophagaceae bacterium]|nr:hypothetical protein [Chitinophagaceae bacterium]
MKSPLFLLWFLFHQAPISPLSPKAFQSIPSFQVSILYTIQPEGYTLDYIVTPDSLRVHYRCLFTRCRDSVLYGIPLDGQNASGYYQFVRQLRLDPLQNLNETKGSDRVTVLVQIRCSGQPPQTLLTVHLDQPVIASLITRTNNLIPNPAYRFSVPNSP